MASSIFVEGTVADDADLLQVAVDSNVSRPGWVAPAGVHAEVPFGVPHLACYYSQRLNFVWIGDCSGFAKEAAVMQQDGIAENEENRGTWMEMKIAEATPSHTEKRFKFWKLQLQMVRVFCSCLWMLQGFLGVLLKYALFNCSTTTFKDTIV